MSDAALASIDTMSVVLVGSFNPRIFSPSWFVRNSLLPAGVEESSDVQVISNNVSVFETDWCRIEVVRERFALASTAAPNPDAVRDLALGAFRILSQTPVTALGINSNAHYVLRDEDSWMRFGHDLAPKSALWEPILNQPGTLAVHIQGEREDDYKGHMRVVVGPSDKLDHGLVIDTNDEYRPESDDANEWIQTVLSQEWDAARARVAKIRRHLVQAAGGSL